MGKQNSENKFACGVIYYKCKHILMQCQLASGFNLKFQSIIFSMNESGSTALPVNVDKEMRKWYVDSVFLSQGVI